MFALKLLFFTFSLIYNITISPENPRNGGERNNKGILSKLSPDTQLTLSLLFDKASRLIPRLKPKDAWRPLVISVLALNMAACQPTHGFEDQNSSPTPIVEIYTPQPTPTPTLTPTPTPTLTPTPTPTEETSQAVEQALANWLSGETKISPEQLILIRQIGERLPLGTIREYDPNKEESASYQGVLLGTKEISGQLILMIGFESRDGIRYALPFNAGPLEGGLLVQVVQYPKSFGEWETGTISQRIPVAELAQKLPRIFGRPIDFHSVFGLAGVDVNQIPEPVRRQLLPTIPISQKVYYFIYSATTSGMPQPPEEIASLLNKIPKTVSVETLPSVRGIGQIGDWVTAP